MEDEEDYDGYCEDEEESTSLILSIAEDGKASIHKQEDYVEMLSDDAELIREFINTNKKLFDDFCKEKKKVIPLETKG